MKKAVFKKTKKIISFILIIAIFASSGILSSCSVERKEPVALTINGKDNSRLQVQERYEALRSTYSENVYKFDTYIFP